MEHQGSFRVTGPAPHILIYSDDPDLGGVAQFDHALAIGLKRSGHLVSVVKPSAQSPLRREKCLAGINCVELGHQAVEQFTRMMTDEVQPANIFRALRPDLIVFSDSCPVSNYAAKRAARRLNLPVIVVIGLVAPYLARNFAPLVPELGRFYRAAKAVIAVSHENLQLLRTYFALDAERGEVIRCGRPPVFFAPADLELRAARRRELGLLADDILSVTAARLELVKGYDLQLEALARLRQSPFGRRLHMAWLGAGTLDQALKRRAAELGIQDRVHFLGQRWDVPAWLDAADIFLLPSRTEGMPLCIMEAMAKAVPVAATAVSGIPEQLGNTGRLLPDPALGNEAVVDDLVATLHAWGEDAFLRRTVGAAGRDRAVELFQEQTMLRQYRRVIGDALLPESSDIAPGPALSMYEGGLP
jgi:glycosyltransferase involved in cell wall biosynthesis